MNNDHRTRIGAGILLALLLGGAVAFATIGRHLL